MPDANLNKWHIAHTIWFFETFILSRYDPAYGCFYDAFGFLFNSCYNAIGERVARPMRGMITGPTVEEIVQPKLEAVTSPDGTITDVTISYPQDLTAQMLEYSGRSLPE